MTAVVAVIGKKMSPIGTGSRNRIMSRSVSTTSADDSMLGFALTTICFVPTDKLIESVAVTHDAYRVSSEGRPIVRNVLFASAFVLVVWLVILIAGIFPRLFGLQGCELIFCDSLDDAPEHELRANDACLSKHAQRTLDLTLRGCAHLRLRPPGRRAVELVFRPTAFARPFTRSLVRAARAIALASPAVTGGLRPGRHALNFRGMVPFT